MIVPEESTSVIGQFLKRKFSILAGKRIFSNESLFVIISIMWVGWVPWIPPQYYFLSTATVYGHFNI